MTYEAILAAAGKAALKELLKSAKERSTPLGEWRGELVCDRVGKNLWRVKQGPDPCRLYIYDIGLEYAWPTGGWESDGPTIPWLACKALKCRREHFVKSGFLHDFIYRAAGVYAREPGGDWSFVPLDKDAADVLFRVGVTAEGATRGQAEALWVGVRTPFAEVAWERWRERRISADCRACGNAGRNKTTDNSVGDIG